MQFNLEYSTPCFVCLFYSPTNEIIFTRTTPENIINRGKTVIITEKSFVKSLINSLNVLNLKNSDLDLETKFAIVIVSGKDVFHIYLSALTYMMVYNGNVFEFSKEEKFSKIIKSIVEKYFSESMWVYPVVRRQNKK